MSTYRVFDNITPEQADALGLIPPCNECGRTSCDGLCWAASYIDPTPRKEN